MMDFRDRIALISGASSGIGLATAILLAEHGAHVWLMARDRHRLDAALATVQASCRQATQRCGLAAADVSDPAQVAAAVDDVCRAIGVPDLVINSAGIVRPGRFLELNLADFRHQMEVNYLGTVHLTRAVAPAMVRRGSGHIVNISSAAGFVGMVGYTAYGASKWAVRGFSDALRAELKPLGVRVSLVFPPDVDTPQLAYDRQTRPPEIDAIVGNKVKVLSARSAGEAILRGVARGQYIITPGWDTTFFYWLIGFLGKLQYPLMDLLVARAQRQLRLAHPARAAAESPDNGPGCSG